MTGVRWLRGIYWMLLGVWLGTIVAIAIAAPTAFKTIRAYEPTGVLREPFRQYPDQAANVLAGAVVNNLISGLTVVHWLCAIGLVVIVLGQRFVMPIAAARSRMNHLREALIALAVVILILFTFMLRPKMDTAYQVMYDTTASEQDRANARDRFHGLHQWSERSLTVTLFVLVGATLSSPFVVNRSVKLG